MTKTKGATRVVSMAVGLAASGAASLAAGATPTVVVSFDPAQLQLPESMTAADDGILYASNLSGAIQRIDPQTRSFTTVATVPLPSGAALTGIKIGPDGLIYVISASFSANPDGAFVWRVSPRTGAVQQFAGLDANGFPNDLVFQDDGSLLVTDPFLAQIWSIDPAGHPTVWLADPLFAGDPASEAFAGHAFGVDGVAWGRQKRDLYVSTVDFGRVMRIPMDGRCARQIQIVAEDSALKGIDGIAIDRSGTLWAAVNTQDRIATVGEDGTITVISQGSPFDGPSSLAFGTGRHDQRTLYIANFAITRFQTGQTAHPGVLALPVDTPGLPLR